MTLTDEERRKFVTYCIEEARSYDALAKEAAKLSGGEFISMPMLRKAAAFAVVARHIESGEIVTIEAKP